MGFSPDGRVLSVSLLAPRTGSGSGERGPAAHAVVGCRAARRHPRRSGRAALRRATGQDDPLLRRQPDDRYRRPVVLRRTRDRGRTSGGRKPQAGAIFRQFLAHEHLIGRGSMEVLRYRNGIGDGRRRNGRAGQVPAARDQGCQGRRRHRGQRRGECKVQAADPRIILGGASEDGERLIWIRDDGSAQIVPLAAGALGGEWRSLRALYGRPWHEWTNDFLTVGDNGAARWSLIYRAEKRDAAAWKASLGSIAPAAGDKTMSSDDRVASGRPHRGDRRNGNHARGRQPYRCPDRKAVARYGRPCVLGADPAFFPRRLEPLCSRLEYRQAPSASSMCSTSRMDCRRRRPQIYAGPFVERPDGRRVVALGGNGDGPEFIFDMLGDGTPVPSWIADLAEGVGGWRLGEENVLRPLTPEEQTAERSRRARKALAARKGSADRWAEFAGWYLSDDPDPRFLPIHTCCAASSRRGRPTTG